MKRCARCKVDQPVEAFSRRGDGLQSWCRACFADWDRERILGMFDLTPAEYDVLEARGCSICGRRDADVRGGKLAIDHDHKTGDVRGLLCTLHNRLLPNNVSRDTLHALVAYLDDPPAPRVLGRTPRGPVGSSRKKRRKKR